MTITTYNIVSNKDIYRKLTAELKEAFPDPSATLDFLTLEKLPYLVCARILKRASSPLSNLYEYRLQLSKKVYGIVTHEHIVFDFNLICFRLSYGVIGRLPRVTPEPGAEFNGYSVPAGVRLHTQLPFY